MRNNVDTNEVTSLLLGYYIKLCGPERVNESLLSHWPYIATHCKNFCLQQYMYPLIRSDNKKLNALYYELYGRMNCHISLEIFEWLIDQKEIPDSLLIESISIENINQHYNRLIITNLLWKACVKRLDKDQLCSIIFSIYRDMHQIAVDFSKNHFSRDDHIRQFNAAKLMLDSMIKLIKTTTNRHMELLAPLFNDTCNQPATDMMKIILLNCNHQERIQLFEAYKEKAVDKSKIKQAISETITVLGKLDSLLLLKSDLAQPLNVKSSLNFFHRLGPEQQEMLDLFAPLNSVVFYYDNKREFVTIPHHEINDVWGKVRHYLKSKVVNQNNVICAAIDYQKYDR